MNEFVTRVAPDSVVNVKKKRDLDLSHIHRQSRHRGNRFVRLKTRQSTVIRALIACCGRQRISDWFHYTASSYPPSRRKGMGGRLSWRGFGDPIGPCTRRTRSPKNCSAMPSPPLGTRWY